MAQTTAQLCDTTDIITPPRSQDRVKTPSFDNELATITKKLKAYVRKRDDIYINNNST